MTIDKLFDGSNAHLKSDDEMTDEEFAAAVVEFLRGPQDELDALKAALRRLLRFPQEGDDGAVLPRNMTDREAFERYMYGYQDTTPRMDAQKETRQHFKTWQEACKYKAEACAVMFDDNPNAEMFRDAIAEQIRMRFWPQ